MCELFEPEALPRPEARASRAIGAGSWPFAGLAVLADWLGSNQAWFPYEAPALGPGAYLEAVARPRAAEAVRRAGIRVQSPCGKPYFPRSPARWKKGTSPQS
jgi:CRISPR-associated endonuclease/helicase Cas3